MAMLLSAVLAAGTCLPALAVETTQTEEAGGAASTHIEQVAEVQPEEGGNEAVTEGGSEGSSTEVTVNDEENVGQAADPADDNSENAVVTDGGDSNDNADDSEEIAGEAVTSDAAEIAAEEEPKSAAGTDGTDPSGAFAGGNLLNTQGDASWLNDYDTYTTKWDDGTTAICLNYYNGMDTQIEVPGTVEIEGVTYPVTAYTVDIWGESVESVTFGEGFIFPQNCSYFFSSRESLTYVDMSLADTSRVTDMSGMFYNDSNLQEVNLGSIDVSNVVDVSYMFEGCQSIEELDLSCFSGTDAVRNIYDMFSSCSNLTSVDMGGWDWSYVDYTENLFEGCDSLEELITPANVNWGLMPLPCLMADQSGEIFSSIPAQTGSVTLTVIEVPQWLEEYEFSFDRSNKDVVLENYNGTASEITMPASVTLAGTEYDVKVDSCPWKTGVTNLSFEGSESLRYVDPNFFGEMQDLEVLDLHNIICTWQNEQSFDGCSKLKTIYTPANCSWGSALPGLFKDENGYSYSCLPRNLPNSIRLDAVTCDEWLKDFSYSVSDSKLTLTGYHGDKTELVVPGSAVVDDTTYEGVWIAGNIWCNSLVESLTFGNGVQFGEYMPGGIGIFSLFSNLTTLESIDFSEVSVNGFVVVQDMFNGCSNLTSVDLSGFDFTNCYQADRIFDNCDSLETIETPVNVHCSIALPFPFSDEDGHIYTEIPQNLSESITLTRTPASPWLSDYEYELTDNSIVLREYKKSFEQTYDEDTGEWSVNAVTVPGSAEIGTTAYNKIVLSKHIWEYKGVEELYFDEGVYLPEDCSGLFGYDSLEKIDLSEVNVTDAVNMQAMFSGCRNLTTIAVPKGVSREAGLPGVYVDENENSYTSLPLNVTESFTITKGAQDEWLDDYDYYISGDKIVLTGYHGYATDLTVPGSAVFGDTTISKVELTPGMNWGSYVQNLSFARGVVLPEDCTGLFSTYSVRSIDLSNVDASHATNMTEMFRCYYDLFTIDMGGIDTSNVTNMSGMFSRCYNLQELNISGIDTSNVTNMNAMFANLWNVTELDVSGIDTSNVTDMSVMFASCGSLTELDLSSFDTSNVTNMQRMFSDCHDLRELNLSSFDTSNVTDMQIMFAECNSLTELDTGEFDTSNVTDMYRMFSGCNNLTSLDVSGFDTSKVTDMGHMFSFCDNLSVLDVSGFNTENVTNISSMFNGCNALLELDLSGWDLSSVEGARRVFSGTIPVIKAPVNVPIDVALNANYTGSDGLIYDYLPVNKDTSILLSWASASGDPGGNESGNPSESGNPGESGDPSGTCEHVYSDWEITKEASCTEDGSRERVCTICGNKETETINAIGHQWNEAYTTDKEATCTEDGSESHHCLVCDAIDETTAVVIPAKGHKMTKTAGKEATCTEAGNTEYWTCSRCNKLFSDASGTEETTLEATVIPAKGHAMTRTAGKEATCTEAGNTEYWTCSSCNKLFSDASGTEETTLEATVIPAKGHAMTKTAGKEATCTEAGNTEYWTCSRCNKLFKDASGAEETTLEATVIPAKGHAMTRTAGKEATCTEDGNTEYWTCSRCNKLFSDASGTEETTLEATVIPAKGHVWAKEYTVDKEATCAEEGSESIHCTVCGEMKEDSSHAIPKTEDHKYDEWVVTKEATCAEEGSESLRCTVCGEIKEGSSRSIPKTNDHKYGDWIVTKPATSTETGIHEKVCEICGNKVEEEIPALKGEWIKNSKGWWYSWSDGSYPKSKFENINGKAYYFDASGYMVTGWQKIDGAWYYFSGSGAMVTDWQKIGTTWYYFNESGIMQTGLQEIGGKQYYFSAGGGMQTGWQKIGSVWYYFSAGGAMVTDWQKIGTTWYYFDESGVMQTGWKQINGRWYYFEGSGAMAANKWVGNYYLMGNGAMATNTWIGQYYVGADGKWIPGYKAAN